MTFAYVSVDEAIKRSGVRMVVVGGVPSPWGEAAKGILHVKTIEWAAVRLVYDSEPLKECGAIKAGDQPEFHGISTAHEDDRRRRGCRLCRKCRRRSKCCDKGHRVANQFGSQGRQLLISAPGPAIFNGKVLPFEVAIIA